MRLSHRIAVLAVAAGLLVAAGASTAGAVSFGPPGTPTPSPTPAPVTTPSPVTPPAPGSVPVARTVLYDEGFQNGVNGGGLPLSRFTGVAGDTLTANAAYLDYTECNGIILSGTETLGGSICSKYANPAKLRVNAENSMRGQATALGGFNGLGSSNRAVSFLTANLQLPAGLVELETANPATVSGLTGKFLGFSINSAEVCSDGLSNFVQPSFQLFVKTPAPTAVTGGVNPCQTYGGAGVTNGTVAVLATSNQIGFRVVNLSGGGLTGNDMGLDDFKVWDETPQLTKSFSPTVLPTNALSKLTFTITNTADLQAKNGWSFLDSLPLNLALAKTTAIKTTCPSGSLSSTGGGTKLTVKGNLSAGMVSCTVTVSVTSANPGIYTITVTNTGQVPYTATDSASFSDSLLNVLDDATYNNDVTATSGTAVYTSSTQTLAWSGALALAQTVTITYSVLVNSPDLGDLQLDNTVVTTNGGNCITGSNDPACTAQVTDVPPSGTAGETVSGLPFTGVTSESQLLASVLMFVIGGWLLVLGSRRRYEKKFPKHLAS
jgi:Tfp pilus assembly protein FimT